MVDGWFRVNLPPLASARTVNSPPGHVHGRYSRDLQDLLAQGRPVVVRISLQRWRCRNALCRRQTFGSRMPEAAGYAARRTRRVSDLAGFLGLAVGGRPAHRLTARLGLTAGRDTILRALKLKRAPQPAAAPLRVVGIDDWSWRKGSTYGTLIMDLERRQVIDLPGTLNSAPHHASNRQANTLETGTSSRSKAAPDHAAIRHVFRRHFGTHLSGVSAAPRWSASTSSAFT